LKRKFATGINDTGGKFATGVNDAGGKLLMVSMTPLANLPLLSTPPVANNGSNIRLLTTYSELEGKNYLYANSTTQRCPKEIMNFSD
jgi:hypothetical protein